MHLVWVKCSGIKALMPTDCYPISKWFLWGFVLRMNQYTPNLAMWRSGCLTQQLSRHHRCLLLPYNNELTALNFTLGTWAINTNRDKSTCVAYTRPCIRAGSKARSWIGLPWRFGVYPNPWPRTSTVHPSFGLELSKEATPQQLSKMRLKGWCSAVGLQMAWRYLFKNPSHVFSAVAFSWDLDCDLIK